MRKIDLKGGFRGIEVEGLPYLTGQERIDGIEPIVNFFVEESLQQVASVLCDDTGN
jgi:hypothetical protein